MPTRRELLIGAAMLGLGTACGKTRKVTRDVYGGVDFKILVPQEPDTYGPDEYPMVVAIHGIGGAPEHWVDGWRRFPGRAQIALPRGFQKHGEGFSWFPWSANMKDEKLAADVAAAEERLWKGLVLLARRRRVVVAGYAQGAVLTFAMAARHPDAILGAFPVAGACPDALLPKTRAAPVIAFHGTKDDLLAIDLDRAAIEAFKRQGNRAELHEYPGAGHDPTDAMHHDLDAEMLKTLDSKS